MSRQSKNARNLARARSITALHQGGNKGPAKTTPQHGKKNAWWQKFGDFATSLKSKKRQGQDEA